MTESKIDKRRHKKLCTSIPKVLEQAVQDFAKRTGTPMSRVYSMGASMYLSAQGRLSPLLVATVSDHVLDELARLEAEVISLKLERSELREKLAAERSLSGAGWAP